MKGLTEEMAVATENAYRLGVDIPFGVGTGAPGIAQGGAQNGMAGFFREMAGVSAGTAAGWTGGSAATALIGLAFSPEIAVGVGVVAAVGFAYLAGKAVTTGVDAFNQWMSQAPASGQQVHTLADGTVITINSDQSYAIAKGGNSYSYDAQGNLSSTYIASQGVKLDINNQTGVINATDSTGAALSTKMQTDVNGNLVLSNPSTGAQLGTLSQDVNGGYVIVSQGNQVIVPQLQPGQNPVINQVSADGTSTVTTYNELTKQTTIDWSTPNVGTGTQVTELNGSYQGTWNNVDGLAGSVTFDATTQQLNMSWLNPDHTVGTVVSDINGAATTIYDVNGNVIKESWASNPNYSSGSQTLTNALSTTADALNLFNAIQTGNPLPVAVTGLNLVNQVAVDSGNNYYNLAASASIGNGILDVMSLENELKNGNTLGAIVAGTQTAGAVAQAAVSFAAGSASPALTNLSNELNGVPPVYAADGTLLNPAGTAGGVSAGLIGDLNLVNDIANGNTVGTALDVLAIAAPEVGVPLEAAYSIFNIVSSLFGSDNSVPPTWGSGQYVWSGSGIAVSAAGQSGGDRMVAGFMNNVLASLNTLMAQEQQQNPGSPLGLIPSRMPTLSYGMQGYNFTDIDSLIFKAANDAVFEMRRSA